jgi:hypothetical protein
MLLNKRQRGRIKKDLRKVARSILFSRYKVGGQYTDNYHALHRYILLVCPELKADGYELLRQFVDKHKRQAPNPNSDAFLESYEWRKLRMEVLIRDGARCACCGNSRIEGRVMHVDHIKPRKTYPELALDPGNLQVLCDICNHGKGNWDQTDWR